MDVEMERLAREGEITEMFVRHLISTGLRVGMAIGDQTSNAAAEAIVTSLATAVLAGTALPSSSVLRPARSAATVDSAATAEPPRCVAHGTERCYWCSLNPSTCDPGACAAQPPCSAYATDGMHWDTCPNRVRGRDDQCPVHVGVDSVVTSRFPETMRCIRKADHDGLPCKVFSVERYHRGFNDPFLERA